MNLQHSDLKRDQTRKRSTTKEKPSLGSGLLNKDLISSVVGNKAVKTSLYIIGAVVFIYVLGKTSKILSVSIVEFKQLSDAIKQ